jgi:transposase
VHRRASSQPQAADAWPRCSADAGQICAPVFEGQKNDFRDAEAIAEAVQRPTMKFVATKTADQLDLQALHGVRERLVRQRTGIINQIRAFLLERGIAVPPGCSLSAGRACQNSRDAHRHPLTTPVDRDRSAGRSRYSMQAADDGACVGPIISSAIVAAIGSGDGFSKGRDFGAWLGLVPKQISTGDRTILGKISRRGNRYLRVLFVQAAWVVLVRIKCWERYGLKSWIEAAKKRLHHNVLAIALANKLARIAWAVLNKGRAFECVKTDAMASRSA